MTIDSLTTDSTASRPFPDPPRHVPLSLRLGMLFGGGFNQFGWFIIGFGMIFYRAFTAQADFEVLHFSGPTEKARGTVTAVEETNYKINKRRVHRVDYVFDVNGQAHSDASYVTGSNHRVGDTVSVEYPEGKPTYSRIEGARASPMPVWSVFFALFPFVGIIFLTIGFRRGRQVCRLLTVGESSVGTLVDKEPTNTQINKRRVFRFKYEFPAADGNIYAAKASTHLVEKLADERQPLLYDPRNPGEATLVAHLHNKPEIDADGQLRPLANSTLFWTLLLPTLSTVGHGGYALWQLASSL